MKKKILIFYSLGRKYQQGKSGNRRQSKYFGGCAKQLARSIYTARSLIRIGNTDGLCLARSIVTAVAKAEHQRGSRLFFKLSKNIFDLQTRAAVKLLKLAKLATDLPQYNLTHAKSMQRALDKMANGKFRIVILDGDNFCRVIYKGLPAQHNLFILLEKGHFQPIVRPGKLFRVCFF